VSGSTREPSDPTSDRPADPTSAPVPDPASGPRIEIAPSVLPVDFSKLGDEVAALEAAGVDRIQWDVMDGQFVPNLTFGPSVIASARRHTSLPFEAHLMVYTPDVMAAEYVAAGCARLIVHAEACTHLHRTLANIASLGATASVALNPATPASAIAHVLDLVDMVLVMTVNPGFGGQAYIGTMEPKIREVRDMIERAGLGDRVDLEVDGGIGPATIAGAAAAGANILVAGSALFRDPEGLTHAVSDLRATATAAFRR
jgi:ribulose-phosphate 3-epimerase